MNKNETAVSSTVASKRLSLKREAVAKLGVKTGVRTGASSHPLSHAPGGCIFTTISD